jgi:hypothetical protein
MDRGFTVYICIYIQRNCAHWGKRQYCITISIMIRVPPKNVYTLEVLITHTHTHRHTVFCSELLQGCPNPGCQITMVPRNLDLAHRISEAIIEDCTFFPPALTSAGRDKVLHMQCSLISMRLCHIKYQYIGLMNQTNTLVCSLLFQQMSRLFLCTEHQATSSLL